MAKKNRGLTLEWRAERQVWEIVWFESGKRKRKSTGASDRHIAEKKLFAFMQEEKDGQRSTGPADPSERTIDDILACYGSEHARHIKSASIAGYNIESLLDFWSGKSAAEVTHDSCTGYISFRQASKKYIKKKTPLNKATIARELGVLQAAINHDFKMGRLIRQIHVWKPTQNRPKDRWLTRNEAALLLRTAHAPYRFDKQTGKIVENRARRWLPLFILLGLYTAARKEAILTLRWTQVNLEEGIIDFNEPGRERTKKRRAVIAIPHRLMTFLRYARARGSQTGYVMAFNGRPVGEIKKSFKRIADSAGLSDVTPHTLRHTAASWMAQACVSFPEIASYLGHSNSRTTERVYAHHNPNYLKAAAAALDSSIKVRGNRGITAPMTAPTSDFLSSKIPLSPWEIMVGATGFEPVTPTMSR